MTVAQLVYKARVRLGDPNKTMISDYSLVEALKGVLTLIGTALATMTSTLLIHEVDIALTEGSGDLPVDFQSIVSVETGWLHAPMAIKNEKLRRGSYKILNNRIYANADSLSVQYKRFLQVGGMEDSIALPENFNELIIKYIKIVLADGMAQSDAALLSLISPEVYRLAAGRERTELRQRLIFRT